MMKNGRRVSERLDESSVGATDTSQGGGAIAGILGLSGKVFELGNGAVDKVLPPESISIFTVAEKQIAHFKAKIIFRLATPGTDVEALKLELPSTNLIVFYVQLIIGDLSIYRVGIQEETEKSLIYTFGKRFVRSSIQVIIRGSFKYLENPSVGLVTLLFPSLVGSYHKDSHILGNSDRRTDEMYIRELRLDIQCLLTLPAPFQRLVGCQNMRSVSPDGNRVFLRHTEGRNIWDSVEMCILCGTNTRNCPSIVLHQPPC